MKITCTKKELSEAINTVIKAVAVKPPAPIMSCIYLKAEGSALELEANNLDLGIKTKIPANTEKPGEIVVSGKYLQDMTRKLAGEIVSISYDDEAKVVMLQSELTAFRLLAYNVEDWVHIKPPEVETTFKLPAITIKNLIRKTFYACSTDEARPMFTGCLLQIEGSAITMVGTNTHRIAIMRDRIGEELDSMKYIIPSKALGELLRLADESNNNMVEVRCSAKDIDFAFDNVYIKTRLLSGDFPPFEKVIPRDTVLKAQIETSELMSAIDRVGLISKETDYKTIKFSFKGNELMISSTSPEIGNAEEKIGVKVEGDDMDIAFNVNYLIDALKTLDTKMCSIRLAGRLKPADIREVDSDDFIYIVTPIRTT